MSIQKRTIEEKLNKIALESSKQAFEEYLKECYFLDDLTDYNE
jgi:hypothetical protein